MSTYTNTMQLQALVNAALRKLSVLSGGSTPESFETSNATEALQAMLLGFQTEGMPIWAMNSYTFPTVASVGSYTIGVGATLNTPMPLKIVQAWRSTDMQANIPMNIYTNYNYNLLPQTAGPSTPVNLTYQPGEGSLSSYGTIQLWPLPMNASNIITIRYQRPFADMVNLTDEVDFPRYWYEAIIYGLAARLAPEYGTPMQDRQIIRQEAEQFKQAALSFGTEEGSIYFQPDWSGR